MHMPQSEYAQMWNILCNLKTVYLRSLLHRLLSLGKHSYFSGPARGLKRARKERFCYNAYLVRV